MQIERGSGHGELGMWHRGDRVILPDGRLGTILLTNQRAATVEPAEGGPTVYVDLAETLVPAAFADALKLSPSPPSVPRSEPSDQSDTRGSDL